MTNRSRRWGKSGKPTARKLCELRADVEAINKWGENALHLAARQGEQELVRLLMMQEADVDRRIGGGDGEKSSVESVAASVLNVAETVMASKHAAYGG